VYGPTFQGEQVSGQKSQVAGGHGALRSIAVGGNASIVRWVRVIGPAVVVLAAIFSLPGTAGAGVVGRDAARPPSQVGPRDDYTPIGPLVADTGFRPPSDGFKFKNYDCDANTSNTSNHSCVPPETNLTSVEMHKLFGDRVCAATPSDTCTLSSRAQAWMDQTNTQLAKGGHCFGFSVTSLQLWKRLITPDQFGATSTPAIQVSGNQAIQREIAYTFVTQGLRVRNALVEGTPNQILQQLVNVLEPNATDTVTIGFFNGKQGAQLEGHAVTPYAVENRGGGIYAVLIYDNNFPGVTRAMLFDTNSDTWAYQLEPSLIWRGSASDPEIALAPTSATVGLQPCPFCGKTGG
jgi:hypothetical protein